MENYVSIVQEASCAAVEIGDERLKFINSKDKFWEYAGISLGNYQNLSLGDCSLLEIFLLLQENECPFSGYR